MTVITDKCSRNPWVDELIHFCERWQFVVLLIVTLALAGGVLESCQLMIEMPAILGTHGLHLCQVPYTGFDYINQTPRKSKKKSRRHLSYRLVN